MRKIIQQKLKKINREYYDETSTRELLILIGKREMLKELLELSKPLPLKQRIINFFKKWKLM